MGPTNPADSDDHRDDACVFVDAGPFSYSRFTGLSRYTARLTLALAGRVPVRFFCDGQELLAPAGLGWSQDQDLATWARKVWRAPRRPLGTPPAGSLGLYCTLRPLHRTFPFEASVLHDFSPYTVPATHLESTRELFGGFFARALPVSDVAIAVSDSTKADAAWLSPMDPDRVLVAHSGPSLCVEAHGHAGPVRRRPDVGLVVSTLEPRKNARFLLDWFLNSAALPADAQLWWVGPMGWMTSRRELKQLRGPGPGRKIRFLGVVGDAALCRLYRTAGWSIYPSLYEGFGFPVLDSLRHGTPTLASGNSSIREFDSPGLHLFDPCDPATLDAAYRAMDRDRGVAIPRGPLDRRYSWDHVARVLLEAHRRARAGAGLPASRAA